MQFQTAEDMEIYGGWKIIRGVDTKAAMQGVRQRNIGCLPGIYFREEEEDPKIKVLPV